MENLVQLTYLMFTDLFGGDFFEPEHLMTFILSAKRYYRSVPYHNFEHAFLFAHCVYVILKLYDTTFDLVEVSVLFLLNLNI